MFRKQLPLLCLLAACVLGAPQCFAHPMGNFSVNHYTKISLERQAVKVSYIIDLAEIPTYQELQQGNITANVGDAAVTRYVAQQGTAFGHGLSLVIDGKPVVLHLLSSTVIFPPGAGGLPTMKMGFVYQAAYPAQADRAAGALSYTDNNYPGHAGWKEIVAAAPGALMVSSSVPAMDRSAALTNYPTDLLNSPPQDLSAAIRFQYPAVIESTPKADVAKLPAAHSAKANAAHAGVLAATRVPAVAPAPLSQSVSAAPAPLKLEANRQATPHSAFTELITARSMSLWFLITAGFVALGLGAMHALEPGHGKTIVAAYLVGSRGTARHAFLLGLIVTVSHTAGVFALGAITLYASRYIVPEQLYPWLGVFSGLTIFGLGAYMFLRRWSGLDLSHSHVPGQLHSHWFAGRETGDPAPAPADSDKPVSLYQLFALGITGGIIPCPAALVVLLSAFALHRIGLGFYLITAFSLGLAAVLIGFGMLMVYGRRFMAKLRVDGPLTTRWLPVASAALMTFLGAAIAFRAFITTGIDVHHLTREKLGPFLFIAGVGLLLGMRHSTDADHVVAVSTIVSKQRSIRQAGVIGSIWGLGHTLTIFAVGSLIILFGVVIPPRLGLSMEFSVALMLILLGVLNLTGVMQRVTTYLTRGSGVAKPSKAETMLDRSVGRFGLYQYLRPLVIGIVHGLAGSAAVALLVLSTIHSPLWATMYLLVFGAGTMVGMMCMTAAMAVPLAFAGNRFAGMSRFFSVASGVVSVCFGCFLVYQLGFLGGLFTSHPQWTPR
jgi:nickel/cobalt exporter